jgi:molybdopterin-binding protein
MDVPREVRDMRISARNVLTGTVKAIMEGTVNAEVVVELPGGEEVVAMVTKASVRALGLEVGKEAHAIVKASNVMLGVD